MRGTSGHEDGVLLLDNDRQAEHTISNWQNFLQEDMALIWGYSAPRSFLRRGLKS